MRYLTPERAKDLTGKTIQAYYNDVNEGDETFTIVGLKDDDPDNIRLLVIARSEDGKLYELPHEQQYLVDDITGFEYPLWNKERQWIWMNSIDLESGNVYPESNDKFPSANRLFQLGALRKVIHTTVPQKPHDYYYEFGGDICRGSGAERLIIKKILPDLEK